ncbi:MAG: META domain-containing protein [Candidatus Acidiferrales bacterium]
MLGLAWAVASAGLAGCDNKKAIQQSAPATAEATTSVYTCPDGFRFSVRVQGESAVVALPTETHTLPQVVAASGTRYEAGGVVFWSKGQQALLETGAAVRRDCQGVPAATPWEVARLLGVEFRAIGQEPGWVLELDQGRTIRFIGDYGNTRVNIPAPEPVRDASGAVTYMARTEAHNLVLVVRETPCQDVMSGERFPYTATVTLDGKELKGCGRTLMTGEILDTYWKVSELGGAAPAGAAPREAHLRLLAEGNRATGSTGCNTFSGVFELEGESLRLGPLVSTRMACLDQSLARQEQEYLRALESADRVSLIDGHLSLYRGTWLLVSFDAVYLR